MSGIYRGVNGSAFADALNIDGDKGDITVSNSGTTWTIDNGAVTSDKVLSVEATKVTNTPSGSLAATDVQAALNELQSDIDSRVAKTSSTGSAVLPSGTTAQRDGTPVIGYTRENSSTGALEYYNGSNWVDSGSVQTGNLAFTGLGQRITGDFNNATLANRLMFQNSNANAGSSVGVMPNGTGANSAYNVFAGSDVANTSFAQLRAGTDTADVRINSGAIGTGTYLPMTFYTGGSERMRIDTSGNVGIGTASPSFKLDVSGSGSQSIRAITTDTSGVNIARFSARYTGGGGGATSQIDIRAGDGYTYVLNETNNPMLFGTNNTERMRIDTAGNVGIGTSSPSSKLEVNGNVRIIGYRIYQANTGGNDFEIGAAAGTGDTTLWGFYAPASRGIALSSGGNERLRITSGGDILALNSSGLGYGSGSGGTVTQATNKSTAVTLNKPTGQITMNNSALAAGTTTAFTLNNSVLGANDTMVLHVQGGVAAAGNYIVGVTNMASGSCSVFLTNRSGGSLSEAVVLNFAVIKGAAS